VLPSLNHLISLRPTHHRILLVLGGVYFFSAFPCLNVVQDQLEHHLLCLKQVIVSHLTYALFFMLSFPFWFHSNRQFLVDIFWVGHSS
jgi:hypothetical protein